MITWECAWWFVVALFTGINAYRIWYGSTEKGYALALQHAMQMLRHDPEAMRVLSTLLNECEGTR